MNGWQATAAAGGAGGGPVERRALVRALLLAAVVALLGQGTAGQAGAETRDTDASGAGTANVLVCEAAGGTAEVTQHLDGGGEQSVYVECHGGYLDGWDCLHDNGSAGTWNCTVGGQATRRLPDEGLPLDTRTLAATGAPAGLVAAVDGQDQDDPAGKERKHKKGKHGKKGGKHRRR